MVQSRDVAAAVAVLLLSLLTAYRIDATETRSGDRCERRTVSSTGSARPPTSAERRQLRRVCLTGG